MGAKDATVEVVAGGFVLRYERWFAHPVDRVWSALTDPDELAGWLAAARLDLAVGGEVMLHWLNTDDEGNEAILHGEITALEPPGSAATSATLSTNLAPTDLSSTDLASTDLVVTDLHGSTSTQSALLEYATDIHGLMRWELQGESGGTHLTFVDESPVQGEHLLKVLAGWHIHLDHLEDALDGEPVDWSAWTPNVRAHGSGLSWSDHYQRYSSRLGR